MVGWQPWGWQGAGSGGIAGVRFVHGEAEARAVSIPWGTKALFMDAESDVFYVKEASPTGEAKVDAYEFRRREPPAPPEYVTRAEFDELKERYESVVRGFERAGDGRAVDQRAARAADGPYPHDDAEGREGAGGAPDCGARDHPRGVGRDGEARWRDMLRAWDSVDGR